MLDAAFENWASSLNERGFDSAFLSLLRANGYYDVHFTHGAYEFGKDVIAKRMFGGVLEQHAFQSKAGDISGSVWDGLYSQMNELLGTALTHPNFDRSAPQVRHLVTTGRLTGKAGLSANEFKAVAAGRGVRFVVDDAEGILEWLRGLPSTSTIASASPSLEVVVGRIVSGDISEVELEDGLATLIPLPTANEASVWRSLLDLSVCARLLAKRGRVLHASWVLLHGIRLGAVISHGNEDLAKRVFHAAMELYIDEGASLLAPFLKEPESPRSWVKEVGGSIGFIVGYPVAAAHVAEYLAFSGLFGLCLGRVDDARGAIETLVRVVETQPGLAHPISDRAAASVAAAVAALAQSGAHAAAETLLVSATKWLCDRYEDSEAGLAGPYGTPEDETRTLLMAHIEGVELGRRRESLLAVAVADLAHVFVPQRYADVRNDLLAVGIVPMAVHPNDTPDAYFVRRAGGTRPLANVRYPDSPDEPIAHFALQAEPRLPERVGGPVVNLALAAIVRDRLFSDTYLRMRPPTGR